MRAFAIALGLAVAVAGSAGADAKEWKTIKIATEGADNGTRCSRFAFVLDAGTIHSASPKLISAQRAPSTSPVRQAVKTVNSSAIAATPSRARRSTRNAPISA